VRPDGPGGVRAGDGVLGHYAAFTTLFERRQRVHTRIRRIPPFTIARTACRFGSNRRALTLWAWLFCRPTTGVLPQISQCFAINSPSSRISKYIGRLRDDQTRRIGRSARGLGGLAFAGAYEAFQHVEQRPLVCRLEFVDVARCLLDSSEH